MSDCRRFELRYFTYYECQVYFRVQQNFGVGVVRNQRFLGGVGFLTTLGVGVGFFLSDSNSGGPIGSFFTSHF